MMGMDMGLMTIVIVVVALIVVAGLVAAVYLGARALRAAGSGELEDAPRAVLDRRLAQGEISAEDYYERESALRSAEPRRGRRR